MGIKGPATRPVSVDDSIRVRVLQALASGASREDVAAAERLDFRCVMQLAAAAGWPRRDRLALAASTPQRTVAASQLARVPLPRLVEAAMASRHPGTHAAARAAVLAVHQLARVLAADTSAPDPTSRRRAPRAADGGRHRRAAGMEQGE
jgi:voltage-gated potassium channel Kch